MDKSLRNQMLLWGIFFALVIASGWLIYLNSKNKSDNSTPTNEIKYQKETEDLYVGVSLERDQKGLTRGRFVKLEGDSLYLEYYYGKIDVNTAAPEAILVSDSVFFNCEERYFTASDGVKIDKLNAMTDTSGYVGEYITGGLGLNWFKKNAKVGEAVEVRFLGDGKGRIPTQVLLYKDNCGE